MMEFDYREGRYLFTDEFGHVWRLTPTGDESMPLVIEIVAKSNGTPPFDAVPVPTENT